MRDTNTKTNTKTKTPAKPVTDLEKRRRDNDLTAIARAVGVYREGKR